MQDLTPTAMLLKHRMLGATKIIWTVVTVIVLLVTLWLFDHKPNSDVDMALIWSMLILSFPASWLVILAYSGLAYIAWTYWGILLGNSYLSLTATWFAMFAIGYFQWFYLSPYLVRRWKKKKQGPTAGD